MFNKRYKSHHDVKNIIGKLIKSRTVLPMTFKKHMNTENNNSLTGIYVHTPYCDKICSFCNMNRKLLENDLIEYTNYLCEQFQKVSKFNHIKSSKISSVFFGGGTPTIYKASQLENILKSLRENFKFEDGCEITFETTLHNLTWDKLEVMKKYGVNRISVGIQTFSDRGRKVLNRTYTKKSAINRLKELKKRFDGLLCIDIIYNYMDETDEEVLEDVRIASELEVDSISFYSLMIHDGSTIHKLTQNNEMEYRYSIENDKRLHDIFLTEILKKGYKILEHTKVTKGTDEYKYIRNINKLGNLIAIGNGSGGRIGDISYYNMNPMMSFYAKDSKNKINLSKLSGIMQYHSFEFSEIKNIYPKYFDVIMKRLKEYEEKGYIVLSGTEATYTVDGVFWGNSLISDLVKFIYNLGGKK